jgi:hypothetical protein
MGLSRKNRKIQASIADALKKGLPLAGLLSSLMVTTGCDVVKGIMNRHTVGRIAPRPSTITTEEAEEPTVQPSQDQQTESPASQNNDAEPRPLMGKPAPPCEEKDKEKEKEKQPRPLMGVPLPPQAEPPADKANQ